MKKSLAIILAACLFASVFAGCSGGGDGSIPPENSVASSEAAKEYSLVDVFQKVVDAYGEDYIPSMDMDENQLKDVVGINMDNVEAFMAQGPMVSTHVDTFIAIKAKEGMGDEVSTQLDAYRDKLLEDTASYPMNRPKIEASVVKQEGDYVFFLMLGKYDDAETDETKLLKFYDEQTAIGVNVLNEYFV